MVHGPRRACPRTGAVGQVLGRWLPPPLASASERSGRIERGCAEASFARQVAMYLAHTRLGLPYAATGRLFGRDRTTARHACRQVEDRREDPRVDSLLDCLERALDLSVDLAQFRGSRPSPCRMRRGGTSGASERSRGPGAAGPMSDREAVERLLRRGLVAREDGRLALTAIGIADASPPPRRRRRFRRAASVARQRSDR